jgi:replicative DNA helicase
MGRLTREEIAERKAAIERAATERLADRADVQVARTEGLQYVRPFSDAYDSTVDAMVNVDGRFRLGLGQIDVLTRGFGPKELVMVVGFSHAGKTQLVNTAILNNRDRRVLFLSMDDPTEMILIKLACMKLGVSAEALEKRIAQGDQDALTALRVAATDDFRNLIVVDQSLSLDGIDHVVREATTYWGAGPDAVIIDYLKSIQGGDDENGGITTKATALKRWEKEQSFPTIVLHQNTRGRGAPGEPITMLSGAYGGEDVATVLMGVRRKRDWSELEEYERRQQKDTITIHVVKNKRPPAKVTPPDGIDFYMDPQTGLIRRLHDDDLPLNRTGLTSSTEALAVARAYTPSMDADSFDGWEQS